MRAPVQKVAAVHDISGFGRASLTVIIPILSTMEIQACPLPTAVLSTHTGGFEGYKLIDLTDHMKEYISHWSKLGLEFDCIYSGYLGSGRQIDILSDFIIEFSKNTKLIVIDPVLGDNGALYRSIDRNMVEKMKEFIRLADIITPNFTEAAFLLNKPYKNKINKKEMKEWLLELSAEGPGTVIITSVPDPDTNKGTYVIAYNKNDGRFWRVKCNCIPAHYPGTGDAFTSVLIGSLLQGDNLPIALDRAVQFVSYVIRISCGYKYSEREGLLLEKALVNLNAPIDSWSYEILQ